MPLTGQAWGATAAAAGSVRKSLAKASLSFPSHLFQLRVPAVHLPAQAEQINSHSEVANLWRHHRVFGKRYR